jgi:DNA primase large subunit
MIQNMSKQYTGKEYSGQVKSEDAVRLEDIDMLASRSYPLCMRELHAALRQEHKLKHGGRLQYGLFLKVR